MLLKTIVCLAGIATAHPHRTLPPRTSRPLQVNSHRFSTVSRYTTTNDIPGHGIQLADHERREPLEYVRIATSKVQEIVPNATFRLQEDFYVGTNGVAHVHFLQTIDGVDVDDANFNVNILADGTILSFGNSFQDGLRSPSNLSHRADDLITPSVAFERVAKLMDLDVHGVSGATAAPADEAGQYIIRGIKGITSDPRVKLAYVRKDAEALLAWRVETNIRSNSLLTYVDATSGEEVVGVIDQTHTASYEAYPWGSLNPVESRRRLIQNPEDMASSPFGWHSDGTQDFTTLRGNNAYVTISWGGSVPSSPELIFSYPYSPATTDSRSYAQASATHGFYTINKFHDILYVLGFNEVAGNFQSSNNGKGGRGGDPVNLVIQSSLGSALINVPGDGGSPQLSMGVRTGSPARDFVFDSTVLLHEYMHGVTIRLVGAGSNTRCLSTMDGLSLNEGYSDFVPTLLRVKEGDTRSTDYTIADWVMGSPVGLRSHYISTSLETTPLTFESLNRLVVTGGFDLATVWASALYDIFWNLVDDYGIGDVHEVTLGSGGVPQGARFLMLKLILDSEALMPCNPNHLQARDALLDADRVLTGGVNRCAIWRGLARRGFGQNATVGTGAGGRVNGFTVPPGC